MNTRRLKYNVAVKICVLLHNHVFNVVTSLGLFKNTFKKKKKNLKMSLERICLAGTGTGTGNTGQPELSVLMLIIENLQKTILLYFNVLMIRF